MKNTKLWTVALLVMFLAVTLVSPGFAVPKDYATLQWDFADSDKKIRITLTGVVGEQVDKYNVNTVALPNPYYYEGVFVGLPVDYENKGYSEFNVHSGIFRSEPITALKENLAQGIIEMGEGTNRKKITNVKLIPIVEGATMKIELLEGEYYTFYQFHYAAFTNTHPILMTRVDSRGVATHYYEMWSFEGEQAQTRTFNKKVDENGSFRIYPFPDEYNTQANPIAFYVVSEGEAKSLMGGTVAAPKAPTAPQVSSTNASPVASKVLVNGNQVSFEAYNINGNNFFKLRDFAKVVSDTEKQFAVGYDSGANAITLKSGIAYTTVGGELAKGDGKAKSATATSSKIYVNERETPFTAYNIGDNNYFKLRDVAKAFDIGVGWDGVLNTITIDTSVGYTE